jgi:hypothetical protein
MDAVCHVMIQLVESRYKFLVGAVLFALRNTPALEEWIGQGAMAH